MQATLPTGTVTLLFTDVEGSTQALHRLEPRYRDALELHEIAIRTAIAAAGGVEVDTQGDSFFVAFAGAVAAVGAAARIQAELGAAVWPEAVPLRVRIGIHTGEPERAGDRYVGLDVNRAARIAAVAHGGQIVVSAVTRSLVGARAEVEFIDLGRARLKDFAVPERLFEAVLPGLGRRFPPLRTVSETNVPELAGTFVGRKHELATLGACSTGRASDCSPSSARAVLASRGSRSSWRAARSGALRTVSASCGSPRSRMPLTSRPSSRAFSVSRLPTTSRSRSSRTSRNASSSSSSTTSSTCPRPAPCSGDCSHGARG